MITEPRYVKEKDGRLFDRVQWRHVGFEDCHACGHRVWAEYDEDGMPREYVPVESEGDHAAELGITELLRG